MSKARDIAKGGLSIGDVVVRSVPAIPTNYLECNGASLDTTTYAELFAEIGYTYGGSGASFNVPDYRGEFLRGHANGSTRDPDRASRTDRGDGTTGDVVGSKQADQFDSHNHGGGSHSHNIPMEAQLGSSTGTIQMATGVLTAYGSTTSSGTIISTNGGNETRPTNVNVLYCIKYQ